MRVAAVQYGIERLDRWTAYAEKIAAIVADAAAAGAALVVFPEYGSMELTALAHARADDLHGQIAALQPLLPEYRALYARLARRHRLHLLAPSFPVGDADGAVRNRAFLFAPDGSGGHQDKLTMTRFEAERWGITAGAGLRVFATELGRIAVAICYDAEFPLLVRAMTQAGADVVLVPSCTDTRAGYARVRIAAQARALESQCFVIQAPMVGRADWSAAIDENVGAAGVFGPPDAAFSDDGVVVLGAMDRPCLVLADLDLDRIRALRADGEVLVSRDWERQQAILASPVTVTRLGAHGAAGHPP